MSTHRLERLHLWIKWLLLAVLLALAALVVLYFYQGGWERMRTSRTLARLIPSDFFQGPQVAIISGHRGFDSGAVCKDGLMEALVNEEIATRVVDLLQKQGVSALLLDEYDPRLQGLHARALLSIHADSCIDQSGFKVASAEQTVIPEQDQMLVDCLRERYSEATGLAFRPTAITKDMTQYHAFQRVADDTPGAIIETGYLGGDRALLVEEPDKVAAAITAGILCFLDEQEALAKTPTVTVTATATRGPAD
jgi:N-acetylmuramoyl-L-alanine amidase